MNAGPHRTLLNLLRAQSTHWGLTAPTFTWWAAGTLLLVPLSVLAYLWWRVREESRRLEAATSSIERLGVGESVAPGHGLSAALYQSLAQIFAKQRTLRAAWNGFSSLVVPRRHSSGEEEYWASENSGVAFTEAALIEGRLNRSAYSAVPGIVTGLGLLFTFLAILVALLDVEFDPKTAQISGLQLLISRIMHGWTV